MSSKAQTSEARNGIRRLRDRIQLSKEASEPYAWYVVRPVSLYITLMLARLPITPNHVTVAAMLTGVSAGAVWALGSTAGTLLIGGLLFQIMYVLDCADGELARLQGAVSQRGAFIDLMGHFVVNFMMILGVSIWLARFWGLPALALGITALAFHMADVFQRLVLLKVTFKAGTDSAKIYEAFSFSSWKRNSPVITMVAFLASEPGFFTGVPIAAAVGYFVQVYWTVLGFMVAWTLIICVKLLVRLRRIYVSLS